jgi:uncharacterized iron-regulated protein
MLHRMTLGASLRASSALLLLAMAACAPNGAGAPSGAASPAPSPGMILDLATGAELATPADLATRLAAADVVILGERHDNPAHHEGQAELVWRIASHVTPAALVFEMIPPSEEPEMAELRGRGASGDTFGPLIGWDELGWPDWQMYAPILDAAPETPVLGAAVPRDLVRAAMQRGAAAVFAVDLGGDAAALGVNQQLPDGVQSEMEAEQIAAHCDALPAEMAGPMVEAQRLRDAAFAAAVLRGRGLGAGPVILITGSGHARVDRGVPAYISAAAPDLDVISVAFAEVGNDEFTSGAPYDYVWFTEPFDRGDPCAAFR